MYALLHAELFAEEMDYRASRGQRTRIGASRGRAQFLSMNSAIIRSPPTSRLH